MQQKASQLQRKLKLVNMKNKLFTNADDVQVETSALNEAT